MKKWLVFVQVLLIFTLVAVTRPVYAHFSIRDANTGAEASLHVSPDDDPIAGDESTISFDFGKSDIQSDRFKYSLSIKDEKNKTKNVSLKFLGNSIFGKYTFPQQGLYRINLEIKSKDDSDTTTNLDYAQRVSRGTARAKTLPQWAKNALIITVLLGIATLIFVFNRREDIIKWILLKSEEGNR